MSWPKLQISAFLSRNYWHELQTGAFSSRVSYLRP